MNRSMAFWKKQLMGQEEASLPVKDFLSNRDDAPYARIQLILPEAATQVLERMSKGQPRAKFALLVCAFSIVASRYTRSHVATLALNLRDLGLPVADRTVPLNISVQIEDTFKAQLDQLLVLLNEAARHRDAYRKTETGVELKDRLRVGRSPCVANIHTLAFDCDVTADDLALGANYRSDIYRKNTVQAMLEQVIEILLSLGTQPNLPESIRRAQSLCARSRLVGPERHLDPNRTLLDVFNEAVARYAGKAALRTEQGDISYRELFERAIVLANELKDRISAGDVVGVCSKRSIDSIIAVMAILKLEAVYLPLDPDAPAQRRRGIIDDCNARGFFLRDEKGGFVFEGNTNWKAEHRAIPNGIAYIIYTSGSTGQPKGVPNYHRSIVNRLNWMKEDFDFTSNTVFIQKTSLQFDVSIYELFGWMFCGGTLVVPPADIEFSPGKLAVLMAQTGVTIVHFVPSMLSLFCTLSTDACHSLPALQHVVVSGEELKPSQVAAFREAFPEVTLTNLYGPTEAAVDVSCYRIPRLYNGGFIPIGRPIDNTSLMVVDESLKPVPQGAVGQIAIGGISLSPGYIGAGERTRSVFIPATPDAECLYLTGDLGAVDGAGELRYLGRLDQQIKLHGLRMEPGEIEQHLVQVKGVVECVVKVVDQGPESTLCAFYTGAGPIDEASLRQELSRKLPKWMIPSGFVWMDDFPRTVSGKVDRKQLLVPTAAPAKASPVRSGSTETEIRLVKLWSEIVRQPKELISIETDFFITRTSSLLLIRFMHAISKAFKQDVSFSKLQEHHSLQDLAAYLDARGQGGFEDFESLAVRDPNAMGPFPLTDIQFAYYVGRETSMALGGTSNHGYFEFQSTLEPYQLASAINQVIARHSMLRTVLLRNGSQQILTDHPPFVIPVTNALGLSKEEQQQLVLAKRVVMKDHIFDPHQWPMIDMQSMALDQDQYFYCVGFDPIVFDAYSFHIFWKEVIQAYEGRQHEWSNIDFSFRDYVLSMQKIKSSQRYAIDKAYWQARAESLPEPIQLPWKRNPADVRSPNFRQKLHTFPAETFDRLRILASRRHCLPTTVMLTAFYEVLCRWSSSSELAINITLFDRIPFHKDVEHIIGDFTRLLIFFMKNSRETFWNKVEMAQKILNQDLDHKTYDGIEFMREHGRQTTQTPAFPIVFTSSLFDAIPDSAADYFRPDRSRHLFDGIDFSLSQTSQALLDSVVGIEWGQLQVYWNYVQDVFADDLIDRMFAEYVTLLEMAAVQDFYPLQVLNQPAAASMASYNDTQASFPHKTLHDILESSLARFTEELVFVHNGQTLNYRELDQRSRQVAAYLDAAGCSKGGAVGVIAHRCIDTLIEIVGIVRSGRHYVPIDPTYPESRQQQIRDKAACGLVLDARMPAWTHEEPYVGDFAAVEPHEVAYIIFTSGSTGQPKGVVIDHRGVANTVQDINHRFAVDSADRILGVSSLCFDLSVYDLFGAIAAGASCFIVDEYRDMDRLKKMVRDEGITIWNSVPAILDLLIKDTATEPVRLDSLRLVMLSGDWIPVDLPAKFAAYNAKAVLISLGGATEASIWSIYYPIDQVDPQWTSIPYGYPLCNQSLYVLNDALDFCPVGVQGDIYIGGIGVAKEYQADPELTRKVFLQHPMLGRIYRTGDRGIMNANGYMEFCGRKDSQVKVNGYRVEIAEIVGTLEKLDNVARALVLKQRDAQGIDYLVAYVAGVPGSLVESELRNRAAAALPAYMVPRHFVLMERLPLTANGKLDLKSLPQVKMEAVEVTRPRSEVESTLQEIFGRVLKQPVEHISVEASFFQLGMNSVAAVRIVAEINRTLGANLELVKIFRYHTIRKLAEQLEDRSKAVAVQQRTAVLEEARNRKLNTLKSRKRVTL